jgi:two-component sensor histidine kinase
MACEAPVALISLVDDRRQWFKAELGLGLKETPLAASICARVILGPGLTVIPDLSQDSRFDGNPLVAGRPHLRFYAGAALQAPDGLPLGTLCVLDMVPRDLSQGQAVALQALARQVMSQIELRRAVFERDEALAASREVERRQQLLVRELHHRVRNTLAMVQALVGATARTSRSIKEFGASFSARISALAKVQTLLTENYWQTASLRQMAESELRLFDEDRRSRYRLLGPDIDLSADLAVPVGMALHELTTNAVKYGALSVATGQVEVTWDVRPESGRRVLHLDWREMGGPPVRPAGREGFGSTLLKRVLPMQSAARVNLAFDPAGVRFSLEAPLVERRLVPEY